MSRKETIEVNYCDATFLVYRHTVRSHQNRRSTSMPLFQIGDLKLSKELKEKLIGSDREGLGLGIGIGLWLGIIDRRSEPDRGSEPINFWRLLTSDRRSEPNTVLISYFWYE